VTGFLGAGKTSAIRSLIDRRPAGSRWAVLVNEFGTVGIDGGLLSADAGDVVVREVRPDRLLIEPTGLGHPAGIFDALAEPGLAGAIELRTTLCLVDPRQYADPRFASSDIARDQMSLADVLVANKTDLAGAELTARFMASARQGYPPKLALVETRHGQIELPLLDLVRPALEAGSGAGPANSTFRRIDPATETFADKRDLQARGWIHPAEAVFDERRLRTSIDALLATGRYLRAKGLFRVGRSWRALNYAGDRPAWEEIAYRRDSRLELLAAPGSDPAWSQVEAALLDARKDAHALPENRP